MSQPDASSAPDASLSIVVDRIEGDVAVLDINGTSLDVPLAALPEGAGEGSPLTLILGETDGSALSEAEARLERLKQKNPPKMSFDL